MLTDLKLLVNLKMTNQMAKQRKHSQTAQFTKEW